MNSQNSADIIDAVVREHRRATRRVRTRLAAIDEEARQRSEAARSASARSVPRRAGMILRSATEAVSGDDVPPETPQRPVRWLS
ncbi:hypothetical protein HQ325_08605 [Rhodococcus sp. BP-349]|uniref:hypothetical protein n=1 Tax=unclassified Rhodococcus (in: high G+C Gram-positive bacteria) TaxID=192944 RepID=UPI001C9B2B9D|nr:MULTISPECIES: hypothetical protein [unclassified Rhodococcus (in: high G+C Gram-positive bacteria)]MBY6538728.1 hypothetical protein [Rhodococcus sp. BP-363]MBY6543065.1 hypothetical protein [Rhodococcus sp. BP-369]MBY6562295.1 hypothetical protein [Rhodococcus sp. BP-370]MBY6576587.1 hypothetical protein [Rhodococcus sp. BP-364]MBY6585888.1 hypothetical protein [Rhodococcus sp. BP-358]